MVASIRSIGCRITDHWDNYHGGPCNDRDPVIQCNSHGQNGVNQHCGPTNGKLVDPFFAQYGASDDKTATNVMATYWPERFQHGGHCHCHGLPTGQSPVQWPARWMLHGVG